MDNELLGPIVRAFRLVGQLVISNSPRTGKELSDSLDLPPSTTHRLLQILGKIGIVERIGDGQHYGPGPELFRLAFSTIRQFDMTTKSRPFLQAVVDRLDATSVFWIYSPSTRVLVPGTIISSRHQLDFMQTGFLPRGLAWGSVGRAVLAHLPAEEVNKAIQAMDRSPTGLPADSPQKIRKELQKVREQGFAYSIGHTLKDAIGFAAPIFDHEDQVIGCIGCTMPVIRYEPEKFQHYADVVMGQARAFSRELGARNQGEDAPSAATADSRRTSPASAPSGRARVRPGRSRAG